MRMNATCEECEEEGPFVFYRVEYKKYLCENDYALYRREDREQWEPVPYPDADEILEDQRVW